MCLGYLAGWLAHMTWPGSLGFEARLDPLCHSCTSEEKKDHRTLESTCKNSTWQSLCLWVVQSKRFLTMSLFAEVFAVIFFLFSMVLATTSTSEIPLCGVSSNFQVLQICGELCRRGQRRQQGQTGTFTLGGKRGEKRQSGCNSYAPDLRRSWTGGSIHLSASKRPAGSARRQDERGVVLDSHRFGLINGALDPRPALQLYLDTVMNWRLGAVYTIFFFPFFFFQLRSNSPWAEVITHVGNATFCL